MSRDSIRVPPEYRASGLLLHVTSRPSPHGSGDVGPAALEWIDLLTESGKAGGNRCRSVLRATAIRRRARNDMNRKGGMRTYLA